MKPTLAISSVLLAAGLWACTVPPLEELGPLECDDAHPCPGGLACVNFLCVSSGTGGGGGGDVDGGTGGGTGGGVGGGAGGGVGGGAGGGVGGGVGGGAGGGVGGGAGGGVGCTPVAAALLGPANAGFDAVLAGSTLVVASANDTTVTVRELDLATLAPVRAAEVYASPNSTSVGRPHVAGDEGGVVTAWAARLQDTTHAVLALSRVPGDGGTLFAPTTVQAGAALSDAQLDFLDAHRMHDGTVAVTWNGSTTTRAVVNPASGPGQVDDLTVPLAAGNIATAPAQVPPAQEWYLAGETADGGVGFFQLTALGTAPGATRVVPPGPAPGQDVAVGALATWIDTAMGARPALVVASASSGAVSATFPLRPPGNQDLTPTTAPSITNTTRRVVSVGGTANGPSVGVATSTLTWLTPTGTPRVVTAIATGPEAIAVFWSTNTNLYGQLICQP